MRVMVRGAYRMKGTAKKSGAAYDMCRLVIEVPQETVATQTMNRVGLGMDQKELEMTEAAFARLQSSGMAFPFPADLVVGSKLGFRGIEAIIDDVKPAK